MITDVLSVTCVVQSLDVSGCVNISAKGLDALASLTQLTSLHARHMMLSEPACCAGSQRTFRKSRTSSRPSQVLRYKLHLPLDSD